MNTIMTSSTQIKQSPKGQDKVLKSKKTTSSDTNIEAEASIEKEENSDKQEEVLIDINAKATYQNYKKTTKNLKKMLCYAIKSDLESELLYVLNNKYEEAKEWKKKSKKEWKGSKKLLKLMDKKA